MTRKNTWVFHFFIILLTAILSIHLVWHYTPLKKDVHRYLVSSLKPFFGNDFQFEDFAIGLGYLTFYNVQTYGSNNTFELELEEVQAGFSLVKLFLHRFNPIKVIESITLKGPRLVLNQSLDSTDQTPPQANEPPAERILQLLQNLQNLPEIDRILIADAEIVWRSRHGKRIQLLHHLNGYFIQQSRDSAYIELTGSLLNDIEKSATLRGYLDYRQPGYNLHLAVEKCELNDSLPLLKTGIYQLHQAQLSGDLQIYNNSLITDSLQISGHLNLQNFMASFFHQNTTAEQVILQFHGQDITILPFSGRVETGTAHFQGFIRNIFNPEVDWQLRVSDYPVRLLKQSHSIFENALDGLMEGIIHFRGPLGQMVITADLKAPFLQYAVVPFNHVETRLEYTQNVLTFRNLRADFKKFSTRGTGQIDFRSNSLSLQLHSELFIPPGQFNILDQLNNHTLNIQTTLRGDISTKDFKGNFLYTLQGPDSLLLKGSGPFRLLNQDLTFSLQPEETFYSIKIKGIVNKLFTNPTFTILDIKDFPISRFSSYALIRDFFSSRKVHFYFSGPYDFLVGKAKIIAPATEQPIFTLTGSIRNIFSEKQQFKGKFQAFTRPIPITGDIAIGYSPMGIDFEIYSPEVLNGRFSLAFNPNSDLFGHFKIHKISVPDYLGNDTLLVKSIPEGFFTGDIDLTGTLADPRVIFNLSATDFIFNGVGYYQSTLKGQLENWILRFDNFHVSLNGIPVFVANFTWNTLNDSLFINIRGQNVESNYLAETIFRDRELIKGKFTYDISIVGQYPSPEIFGNIEIRDGSFEENHFDLVHFIFETQNPPGVSFFDFNQYLIKVNKFLYIDRYSYTIEGKGNFSIGPNGPLDLKITTSGNVLAEIPRVEPFFTSIQSNGRLVVHIAGSREAPQLVEASLFIDHGTVNFAEIIPPLKNFQADVVLQPGTNFVKINYLKGTINNRKVEITNTPSVEVEGKTLEPLMLEYLGLNFGVLILKTDPAGIPLSIPGLMREGDIGYFAVSGKKPGEEFYFAGPLDQPTVRGTITLFDAQVTYPFLTSSTEEPENNKVIEYLMGINWDVRALAGKGTRYFVDVPAYFDKVHLDLSIDNTSPGLEFTGRLSDETFRVIGLVESSRGRVEYLDLNFRVEKFGAEFTPFDLYPEVYGRAYTTVRDSVDAFPRDIYLVLYAIDPETGNEISKGRWEDFRFKLVSSDPTIGETQEQVLAYLGYSVKNLTQKAGSVGLTMTENLLIRPLVRPLERKLERSFKLDYVRVRSNFTTNLFYLSFQNRTKFFQEPTYFRYNLNSNLDPALLLLTSSEVTLGKYLWRNMYVTYTGQLVSLYDESKLGLNHRFGLEYRLMRNLLLEFEYDKFQINPVYYNRNALNDFRIRLRHSFNF